MQHSCSLDYKIQLKTCRWSEVGFGWLKKKKIIIYPTNWVRHVRSRQLAENPMRVCVCLGIFFRAHNLPASLSTPSVWRKNQTNDGTVRGVTSPGREEKKKSRKQTRAKSHTKGEKYGANGKKCRGKKCPYRWPTGHAAFRFVRDEQRKMVYEHVRRSRRYPGKYIYAGRNRF